MHHFESDYDNRMSLHNTTPVPNEFFTEIPNLTDAEIRVLLLVIRQTHGWKDQKTNQRKLRDRMTHAFIIKKTGLYRTVLSMTIQSLIDLGLLIVSDRKGNLLHQSFERKGRRFLYYQFQPIRNFDKTCSQIRTAPIRNSVHNKRNTYQKKLLQKNREKVKEMQQQLVNRLKKF